MIKIAMVSDTHTLHDQFIVPECDLLIHAGDFTDRGGVDQVVHFFEWLRKQPAKEIVFIAGNHDRSFDEKLMNHHSNDSVVKMFNMMKFNDVRKLIENLPENIHYLENETIELFGFKIYGSPYTPTFGHNWAFNKDRGGPIETEWGKIPKDIDILVTHGPCYGILDSVEKKYLRFKNEDPCKGDEDLLKVINKRLINLKLHVSGHIHNQFGIMNQNVSNTRRVLFCNAAILTNEYKPLSKYAHTIYI